MWILFFYLVGTALSNAYFGQGNGSILLDDVACDGTEQFLVNCTYTSNHNCGHSEDAGVTCPGECMMCV